MSDKQSKMRLRHNTNALRVSIVIPHHNNINRLKKALESVWEQVNTQPNAEVIVVDNGSSAPPAQLVKDLGFYYLSETKNRNSPYSARNRGIEKAEGEVIILLDSTCVPQPNWLTNGLEYLIKNKADIVSANIVYEFSSDNPGVAELWDAAFGVDANKAIDKRNYAPGGCLFVKRKVFDTIGHFEEGIRSGGDYTFTSHAVKQGFSLQFCEDAVVKYPAKQFSALKKKAIRVGKGQVGIWVKSGRFRRYFIRSLLKPFYPPSPKTIKSAFSLTKDQSAINRSMLIKLFLLGWYLRVLQFYGNVLGFIRLR